jgi:hypothetical protein
MLQFLLTHQLLLAAIAVINGASIVALVIGISYQPQENQDASRS